MPSEEPTSSDSLSHRPRHRHPDRTPQPFFPPTAPAAPHPRHATGAHGSPFVVAAEVAPSSSSPSPTSRPFHHEPPYSYTHRSQSPPRQSQGHHSYDHQRPSPEPYPSKRLRAHGDDTDQCGSDARGYPKLQSPSQDYTTPRRPSSLPLSSAMDRDRDPWHPDPRREDERFRPAHGGPSRSRYDYNYHHPQSAPQRPPPPQGPHTSLPRAHPSEHSPPHPPNWSGPPAGGPRTLRHSADSPALGYASVPYGYPYPYPPPSHGEHAPPSQGNWAQWGPPYGAPVYPPTGAPPRIHSGPPLRNQPSPPPPASPSQIHRAPPPPPASAPSPPRDGSSSPSDGYLPGFQPDYDRTRNIRRPSSAEPGTGSGYAVAVYGTNVRPPPTEAYLILRPHRIPRGGWQGGQQVADSSGWTYRLEVLQSPERGKALGVEALRRGWPPLTPPLIVQLHVRDQDDNEIATDNTALARRLVHLTMSVELVSPDGVEARSMMRVRPPSPRGAVQPYYPTSAPPPYSVQRTLLGSSVRTPQILSREGRKGLYFIFQDMIVRPEGRYTLEGKILDLAGPPHIGTSIGVTHPLAYCRTNPFDVIIPQEFPGPVPITALSAEFLRQGERHLGRRPRHEDGETDEAEDGGHNE